LKAAPLIYLIFSVITDESCVDLHCFSATVDGHESSKAHTHAQFFLHVYDRHTAIDHVSDDVHSIMLLFNSAWILKLFSSRDEEFSEQIQGLDISVKQCIN